jgi:hypothetical protein
LAYGYPFDSGILAAIYCGFILLRVVHFWVSSIYLILQLKLSFHHIPKYLRAHRAPGSLRAPGRFRPGCWLPGLGRRKLSFFSGAKRDAFETAAVSQRLQARQQLLTASITPRRVRDLFSSRAAWGYRRKSLARKRGFLFLPPILRIPRLKEKTANFYWAFWLVSGREC